MKSRIVIASALLVLLAVAPAFAHDPQIEEADWGGFDAPFQIPDSAISYALYGYLDENDVDVFQLEFNQPDTRLRAQLIVPVCGEHYADFYPQFVIFAPPSDAETPLDLDLSFAVPEDLVPIYTSMENAEATPKVTPEARPTFIEPVGGTEFYAGPTHELEVLVAGTYYVAVYDPAGMRGDYTLATGYQESFKSRPDQLLNNVLTIRNGAWLHRRCDLALDDPNAIIEHEHND